MDELPKPHPIRLDTALGQLERVTYYEDDEEGQRCGVTWYADQGWLATTNYCRSGADCPWSDGEQYYPMAEEHAQQLSQFIQTELQERYHKQKTSDDFIDDLLVGELLEDTCEDDAPSDDHWEQYTEESASVSCSDGSSALSCEAVELLKQIGMLCRDACAAREQLGSPVISISVLDQNAHGRLYLCQAHGVVQSTDLPRYQTPERYFCLSKQQHQDLFSLYQKLEPQQRDEQAAQIWSERLNNAGYPELARLYLIDDGQTQWQVSANENCPQANIIKQLFELIDKLADS